MMPDVPYFIPFTGRHQWYGHTLPGLFFFCVPAGVALLWLFHAFLKKPLISLFPASQQGRLAAVSPDFRFFPAKRFAAIAASVLIGAASHITWDSFTHANGWIATHWTTLRRPVEIPFHLTFQLSELLQLLSSVAGGLLLLFYYWRWLRRTTEADSKVSQHLPAVLRIFLFAALAIGAAAPLAARLLSDPSFWLHARRQLIGYGAVDGIKIVCLELLLFSLAWHLMLGGRRTDKSPLSHSSKA